MNGAKTGPSGRKQIVVVERSPVLIRHRLPPRRQSNGAIVRAAAARDQRPARELPRMRFARRGSLRRGIRTKQRKLADGRLIGGGAFGVGGLAHLLRNRFYIGEVVYRGETFRGDHEPILDPGLFAAVQARLSAQAVERRCRLRGSPALLSRRLFDEHGQRMTPTHTNKKGVRYLYYVSPAGLRKHAAGVGRVPAPELEALVVDAVRRHLQGDGADPKPLPETDRELVERHLLGVRLSAREVTLHLRADGANNEPASGQEDAMFAAAAFTSEIAPAHGEAGRIDQRRQDAEQHQLRRKLDPRQTRG
jgi:hypothetical protein